MRKLLTLLALFVFTATVAQELTDENILRLKSKYDIQTDLKCQILIRIEVEGMVIPDKEVYVEFSEGHKTRVQGKGLSLLPKRGTVEQLRNLLSTPMQAIFLSKKGDYLIYKLVSLDPSSDWITADITIDPEALLIYESVVNTRKQGTFTTINEYGSGAYPIRTEISFEVRKFSLPLKFIGGEQNAQSRPEKSLDQKGTVILEYTYL